MPENRPDLVDHDLLVRLDVKLDTMVASLAATENRFNKLEASIALKADAVALTKVETNNEARAAAQATAQATTQGKNDTKVEALQLKVYMIVGSLATIDVLLRFLLPLLLKSIAKVQ